MTKAKKKIYILMLNWNDGSEPKNIRGYWSYRSALRGMRRRCQKRMEKAVQNGNNQFLTELSEYNGKIYYACIIDKNGKIPCVGRQPYDWENIVCQSKGYYWLDRIPLI